MGDTPNWLIYPVARRNPVRRPGGEWRVDDAGHSITRTGETKPRPRTGRQGQRTLDLSHRYRCTCGHVGWTCHIDILQRPLEQT